MFVSKLLQKIARTRFFVKNIFIFLIGMKNSPDDSVCRQLDVSGLFVLLVGVSYPSLLILGATSLPSISVFSPLIQLEESIESLLFSKFCMGGMAKLKCFAFTGHGVSLSEKTSLSLVKATHQFFLCSIPHSKRCSFALLPLSW